MKIYQVVIKCGDEIKTTYCDYYPDEYFIINGKKWDVIYYL
jgi:hypothetical protein